MKRAGSFAAIAAVLIASARPAPAGQAVQWDLRADLLSGVRRGEFVLRLTPDQVAGTWTLPRKGIRLAVLDHRGEPVRAHARFEVAPGVSEVIQPSGQQHFTDVPLRFDPGDLPPALYTLQAQVTGVSAWHATTGSPLRVPEPRDSLRANVAPSPRRVPTLSPGQTFLFVTPRQWNLTPRPNTFRDEGAAPVSWGELELKVVTLDKVTHDPSADRLLWFSVDGRRSRVRLRGEWDVSLLPNLYPLLEDDRLDALRTKFEGRQVWAYGGFQVHCATGDPIATGGFWTRASSSAVIRRIFRIHAGGIEIGAGGLRAADAFPSAFSALDPLVVVLTPAEDFKPTAAYSGGVPGTRQPPGVLKACAVMFQMHGDVWDFERTYSLQPPWKAHADWPPAMLRAVLEDRLVIGMTHEMVAWTKGWPVEYGTIQDLKAMENWRFDDLRPLGYRVHFKGGRVVRVGPEGRP